MVSMDFGSQNGSGRRGQPGDYRQAPAKDMRMATSFDGVAEKIL
jgi:hypothetical protein